MNFEQYLKTTAQSIDQEVERVLAEFLNEVKKTNIKLTPFALGLINSCKGGKRIRGTLCKLGFELANSKFVLPKAVWKTIRNSKLEIIKVGTAFEILHAALLIHDDIIDESPTRRDQPSLYQSLGGNHYGISQAISVGDIGFYLPIKIITETNFLDEYKIKALNHLSQTIINTGWGQILDVEGSEDTKFSHLYKTAKYTIAGPLILGAILGGTEEELVRVLGEFGDDAGIAFQIQDDILDGEEKAVDSAKAKALKYALAAKKVIPRITANSKMRKILEGMTEYMVERSK